MHSAISSLTRILSLGVVACMIASTPLVNAHAQLRAAPESFADQVDKLMPAVVNISTTQKIKTGGMRFPGMRDPQMEEQFREFFERMLPPGAIPNEQMEQEAQSLGSGFIIDADGYVVTNNHVIADATEIAVILHDDTKLEAEIVGRDAKTDLALLKVKSSKKLPFVNFGDSDAARVGDWVIAIGNPFGLGGTVTAGIISARARNINSGPFDDFIQTDAAINRGNSGGPLFNTNGEVIGINTAIFSPSGGSIGIGFAVPAALGKPVIAQLREHGRTFRGWLGVKIQDVSDEIAESLGMDKSKGALVAEINPESPAGKAGIKVGDVILTFDGKEVSEMQQLPRMVAETKIGKKVLITVLRDGKKLSFNVTLGELKEDESAIADAASTPDIKKDDMPVAKVSGMSITEATGELRKQFGVKSKDKGLLVIDVARGSDAAKQGLNRGDLILQVNDTAASDTKTFQKAVKDLHAAGRKNALLRVMRGDNLLFITIPTGAEKKEEKAEDEKEEEPETVAE